MARTSRRDSLNLLETAFDSGITHFDVARSYGYGDAESAVGEFAAGRRDQVTIATKLGIAAPSRSRGLDLARAAARRLVEVVPPARRLVRRGAERLVTRGNFELGAARTSLETSLHELRTDYVDLLLLHDCEPEDVTSELLDFLRGRVAAGQVRCFGIATGVAAAREILAAHAEQALVVQVPFELLDSGLPAPKAPFADGFVAHSVLSGLDRLSAGLAAPEVDVEHWSRQLGRDLSRRSELARMMFQVAMGANPSGVTLFSSRDRDRVRANAALAEAGSLEAESLRLFSQMLASLPLT